MALTKLTKHDNCKVKAILGPFNKNGKDYAKLVCKNHKKVIQWLSKADYEALIQLDPNLIEFDGVKERPTRRPSSKDFFFQEKDGRIWRNVYSNIE